MCFVLFVRFLFGYRNLPYAITIFSYPELSAVLFVNGPITPAARRAEQGEVCSERGLWIS